MSETLYSDAYGRAWQERTWNTEFDDHVTVALALPVPSGYVVMLRSGASAQAHAHRIDLEAMANFLLVSYEGSVAQWRDFLQQKSMIPNVLANVTIAQDKDQFQFRSRRFSLEITPDILKIDSESRLALKMAYIQDAGRTVWDVGGLTLREQTGSKTAVAIARTIEPAEGLGLESAAAWKKIITLECPFHQRAIIKDDITLINSVYPAAPSEGSVVANPPHRLLYPFTYEAAGRVDQVTMKSKLDHIAKQLAVYEN